MGSKLPHVGTVETIALPGQGLAAISAKIDTGADSSTIWASDIHEHDHELSFKLFGKASPFYTGQTLTTRDYRVVSVKNSFGQSEFRYKTHLKIVLAGRTIRATFSLSERAKSRYPILIGRHTLSGKFLVDVKQAPAKQQLDVLILYTKHTKDSDEFAAHLEDYGKRLRITSASYDELRYNFGGDGNRITLFKSGRDIASFDLVHFKKTYMDITAATARYLDKRSVPFLNRSYQSFPDTSKLYQYSILADNGIPIPTSVFMFADQLKDSYDYLRDELGLPFVLKDVHGSKGRHNFLITDKSSFKKACRKARRRGLQCLAQVFIDNDSDYRLLVFGVKIALIIQRQRRNNKTHLNNTSQGARATLEPLNALPPQVQMESVAAARLMERQVAGVDFIKDKNSGLWYCLEVNIRPQLATGSFTAEKQAAFAAYLERRLTK